MSPHVKWSRCLCVGWFVRTSCHLAGVRDAACLHRENAVATEFIFPVQCEFCIDAVAHQPPFGTHHALRSTTMRSQSRPMYNRNGTRTMKNRTFAHRMSVFSQNDTYIQIPCGMCVAVTTTPTLLTTCVEIYFLRGHIRLARLATVHSHAETTASLHQ